jgi:hypothetical protein
MVLFVIPVMFAVSHAATGHIVGAHLVSSTTSTASTASTASSASTATSATTTAASNVASNTDIVNAINSLNDTLSWISSGVFGMYIIQIFTCNRTRV